MAKRKTKELPTEIERMGIQCPDCGEIVISLSVHDFRRCSCGAVFVDGGGEYTRMGAKDPEKIKTFKVRLANPFNPKAL